MAGQLHVESIDCVGAISPSCDGYRLGQSSKIAGSLIEVSQIVLYMDRE